MGYTNYYQLHVKDDERFKIAAELFRELEKNNGRDKSILAGGVGEGEPVIGETEIWFNGQDIDSHETFGLRYDNLKWAFTKTARKEYDYDVVLCCVCFKYVFQEDFGFASDGGIEENEQVIKAIDEINKYMFSINGSCTEPVLIDDLLQDPHFEYKRS